MLQIITLPNVLGKFFQAFKMSWGLFSSMAIPADFSCLTKSCTSGGKRSMAQVHDEMAEKVERIGSVCGWPSGKQNRKSSKTCSLWLNGVEILQICTSCHKSFEPKQPRFAVKCNQPKTAQKPLFKIQSSESPQKFNRSPLKNGKLWKTTRLPFLVGLGNFSGANSSTLKGWKSQGLFVQGRRVAGSVSPRTTGPGPGPARDNAWSSTTTCQVPRLLRNGWISYVCEIISKLQ